MENKEDKSQKLVQQRLFFNEKDGKLTAQTYCGITTDGKQEVLIEDDSTFIVSAKDAKQLLAERDHMSFLPFSYNMDILSSETDVMKLTEKFEEQWDKGEERLEKLCKLNDSTETHLQSCEKALNEKNRDYDNLVNQIKVYNDMPFWKRIFKKIVL